ncbi:hypothetical protein CPB86DRAFT_105003 [Serendipita vermifera]|nr:hypothetical protein CPB86DRAFT_105003 [Serendipita vermifera]
MSAVKSPSSLDMERYDNLLDSTCYSLHIPGIVFLGWSVFPLDLLLVNISRPPPIHYRIRLSTLMASSSVFGHVYRVILGLLITTLQAGRFSRFSLFVIVSSLIPFSLHAQFHPSRVPSSIPYQSFLHSHLPAVYPLS